ncbi:GTP cyclohydrolase I FolE2 [Candidatus Bathyarchaeota archaeon]|nr:GTP cyclohydrolase I FolE2 [Candidatus Bathyarchaeota archaeon]
MSRFKADLQAEILEFRIPIKLVGLEDVKKRIEINREDGKYSINLNINAFISLPAMQRGAHMSRSAESIDECITDHIYDPIQNIERFGVNIAGSLLDKHGYSNVSHVQMEGPFIIQMRQREGKASTQAAYYLKCEVIGHRGDGGEYTYKIFLTAIAEGMIACPCGQEMSCEFSKEILANREDLAIDGETVEKILNVIPVATHNQRAVGTLTLQVPHPGAVDIMDMISTIEASMSGKIAGILKRPDEANLIRIVHQDPLFTEDVVRRMAYLLGSEKYERIPDEMQVSIKLLSYESIHPHQCSAETIISIGELRKAIQNSRVKT